MSRLAKNGNRVLFIENTGARKPGIGDFSRIRDRIINWFRGTGGIRQEADNLFICSPIVLPFPYLKIAVWINSKLLLLKLQKWIKLMDFEKPIIWVFLPTPLTLSLIEGINSKLVVYYCIDNFRASSSGAAKIEKSEIELIKKSDLVFVTSKGLFDYCAQFNSQTHLFPFAVNYEFFEKIRKSSQIHCQELENIPKPYIGFIGGIHKWVDLKLILGAAKSLPGYSFILIGPVMMDTSKLSAQKNVYFLGRREHKELPQFIKEFDVCIIPYLITDYTKNVYPTKLNEYLALGKPVVSTALPEILNLNKEFGNLVTVAAGTDEFVTGIKNILEKNDPCGYLFQQRIECAQKNNWSRRIEDMSNLLDFTIQNKVREDANWNKWFLYVLKNMHKKILRLILAGAALYLALFYTPLVWVIAEGLKISQAPSSADAIVVFAGGVGESGKAGEGYEERVEYASDLYKAGFAKQLIFSSGYMYHFREPLIMQALAISLGVPKDAIILEDKANNTYTNILFTKAILDQHAWKSILLVSSPYHMRRVSFVIKKSAPRLKVVFTPVPESIFYRHGVTQEGKKTLKQLNYAQLKAFIHEYLGIVYYWLKGWI